MTRTVLITGAAGGIGTALAASFASAGDDVLLLDRDEAAVSAAAQTLQEQGGRARPYVCDITDDRSLGHLRAGWRSEGVRPAVLINNAGIEMRAETGSTDFLERWRKVMAVNLDAAAFLTQLLIDDLAEARGCVVNIASIQSYAVLHTANTAYAVSKAAIAQLTRAMAVEYAPRGVRVNAVAPGVVETPMIRLAGQDPTRFSRFIDRIPMARFADPREIAGPVRFLASDGASYITGAVLPVDGGFLAM
ncbi:SDR family NAD(P)-dependent oxidoreductase [Aestuariivirga sp.]|uniref:SDR family NAD(P)-dependent oxidoreductase n=1 Tax=Aestuariivirga sp. TaxID=2650926 RepID=UPI0025BE9403|nr:SDR family NAD(P)-dependent oxidoreductase [Aestuariivirga sp.]MCA3555104.1 SDR family oxidoreductase [Aestuariivirga sp.]